MRRLSILLIMLFCFLLGAPVYADMADPDTMTIDTIYANRHLLETDDMLIYGLYTISYGSTPNITIDNAFIFRLIDTDGATQLGADEAYPYYANGFGRGVYAFYFPATAPTWGLSYYVRIAGKPSVFADPPHEDFIIPGAAYSTFDTHDENVAELYANVFTMANTLSNAWGSSYDLVSDSAIGRVLSAQGEAYFRNAIPGLQAMAPSLFLTQIENPDFTTRSWNTTQADTYIDRYKGTWVQTALDGFQNMFQTDWNLTASVFIILGCFVCIVGSAVRTGTANGGFVCSLALVLMGSLQGWVPMAIMAVGSLLCILYIGWAWFFARA